METLSWFKRLSPEQKAARYERARQRRQEFTPEQLAAYKAKDRAYHRAKYKATYERNKRDPAWVAHRLAWRKGHGRISWANQYKARQRALDKERRKYPAAKYSQYKQNAKNRGHVFKLSFKAFMVYWQQPCSYCGDPIETVGIDQIEAGRGYTPGNTVPCCTPCNRGKLDYTKQQYIDHCAKVTAHQQSLAKQAGQLA